LNKQHNKDHLDVIKEKRFEKKVIANEGKVTVINERIRVEKEPPPPD
jgi:hypothetical protein